MSAWGSVLSVHNELWFLSNQNMILIGIMTSYVTALEHFIDVECDEHDFNMFQRASKHVKNDNRFC